MADRNPEEFGPNGDAVVELLETIERLEVARLMSLVSAGQELEQDPDEKDRAALRADLREIAVEGGRLDAIRRVNVEIEAWATSVHHWSPAGVLGTSQSRGELEMRMAAVRVVLDAAYATVLDDLLEDDESELLLRAWLSVAADGAEPGADVDDADADDEIAGAVGVDADGDDVDTAGVDPDEDDRA
jgi:hypothetical protein